MKHIMIQILLSCFCLNRVPLILGKLNLLYNFRVDVYKKSYQYDKASLPGIVSLEISTAIKDFGLLFHPFYNIYISFRSVCVKAFGPE